MCTNVHKILFAESPFANPGAIAEPCDDAVDSESCGSDHDISEYESSTDFSETVVTDGQANAGVYLIEFLILW